MKNGLLTLILLAALQSAALAAKFSRIRNSDDAIMERAREFGAEDPRLLTQKFGVGFADRWVTYTEDAPPAFDPETQTVDVADVVTAGNHNVSRTVRALTAQEITDRDTEVHTALTSEVDLTLALGGAEGVRIRVLIQSLNTRINYLTNRVVEIENTVAAMLDSSGQVQALRDDGIAAAAVAFPQTQTAGAAVHFAPIATRPRADAITDYKDLITSGAENTP